MVSPYLSEVTPTLKMKGFSLSLIVFATVFLLSSALPESKGKDGHKSLIASEKTKENTKFLQKRKPPVKIPGPALHSQERDSGFLVGILHDKESNLKHISDEDKRKGKKDINLKKQYKNAKRDDVAPLDGHWENKKENPHKHKTLSRGERYSSDWKMETQEEKSKID